MNHYQSPSDLIVAKLISAPLILSSEEGSTQGDVLAMAMYALGIKPLIIDLTKCVPVDTCYNPGTQMTVMLQVG